MEINLNQEELLWLNETKEKLYLKLKSECERIGSTIPFIPVQGHYRDLMMPSGLFWWCNGFWPGILWQMYGATGDTVYRDTARAVGQRLSPVLDEPSKLDHDVGFLSLPSWVADYKLTGNEEGKESGLRAAKILADRFHETGSYIQAWNPGTLGIQDVSGYMIADCMMNLPLLYWASEATGDGHFSEIAQKHASTSAEYIVRADGSANHIACLDPQTGLFQNAPAGQGFAPGSSWSRGQGWILYGYALSYHYTGKQEYLDIARRSAHYCIACLSDEDYLPVVDFRAPNEKGRYDSTAGMIIASGLLELSEYVTEYERNLYSNSAFKILKACDEKFNNWNPDEDSIVSGGSLRYHDDKMAGASIIYGDYFLTECILRLEGKFSRIW